MARCHSESEEGTQCKSAMFNVSAFAGALRQVLMDQYSSRLRSSGQPAELPQSAENYLQLYTRPFHASRGLQRTTRKRVSHQKPC
jgi:hypothetical protein